MGLPAFMGDAPAADPISAQQARNAALMGGSGGGVPVVRDAAPRVESGLPPHLSGGTDFIPPGGLSLADEGPPPEETRAVIFNADGLNLAVEGDDGLLWKVACKTGTLALSPGPGQLDVDKPLVLDDELFDDMVLSANEKAFPYITVPETHANGALENTGYVRAWDVLGRDELLADTRLPERHRSIIEADPEETRYLMAGIDFVLPDVKEKAKLGAIPDTSIGVKFGYRNKRTGKHYKAAWEHLALTPVPWVDGLVPFGLSQAKDDEPSLYLDQDAYERYLAIAREGLALAIRARVTNGESEYDWDVTAIDPVQIQADLIRSLLVTGDDGKVDLPFGVCVQRYDGYYVVNDGYERIAGIREEQGDAVALAMSTVRQRYERERERRNERYHGDAVPSVDRLPPWPSDEIGLAVFGGSSGGASATSVHKPPSRRPGGRKARKQRQRQSDDPDFENKHPRGPGGKWTAKSGSSGGEVRAIQRKLNVDPDGRFGDKTEAAVREFQKEHGLQVDGIVGHQTINAMRGGKKKGTPGGATVADRAWLRTRGKAAKDGSQGRSEDSDDFNWRTDGNGKRGVKLKDGTTRVVNAREFDRLRQQGKLHPKNPKLKGDSLNASQPSDARDPLPGPSDPGSLRTGSTATEDQETHTMSKTVEEILAEQQAALEAAEARIAEQQIQLNASQATISTQGVQLHRDRVTRRLGELEHLPPAVLKRAKEVLLGDVPGRVVEEGEGLALSVQSFAAEPKTDEERVLKLSTPTDVVNYILDAIPADGADVATSIATARGVVTELHASAQRDSSASAQAAVTEWEKEHHPERFDADGKRIPDPAAA